MVGFLLLLCLIGGLGWYLVFNEQARRKLAEPGWSFYRRSKDGRQVDDALNLATSLIIAVTCSTVLVAVLIVALIKWLTA
jgi:hypothetical protein